MDHSSGFAREFIKRLQSKQTATVKAKKRSESDLPSYDASNSTDVELLESRSTPVRFQLGTGASIYTTALIPAILSAESEIILVTCFWAKSKTLSALGQALDSLASSRLTSIERGHSILPLRIRICFSSRSLFQKLFHTSSRDGYVYPPSSWSGTLGLPRAEVLESAGIQLQVKTLFFLPFSVMHPKFLIVDRRRAFIPSCNISWEAWLEGCVEIQGPAIASLLDFFSRTWNMDVNQSDSLPPYSSLTPKDDTLSDRIISPAHHVHSFPPGSPDVPTVILPSSHHRNPDFRPLPWQAIPPPPPTPLNVAMLQLIDESSSSIYLQTPNLTSEPVISALLDALGRGINVTIVTSRNMMLLEQLVTAGTTTSWCVRSLVRRYRAMVAEFEQPSKRHGRGRYHLVGNVRNADTRNSDVEAQHLNPGRLRVCYFRSHQAIKQTAAGVDASEEPVHSHLKLTVVDEEFTVLGSGNMDRASWYTSQELGILFQSRDFAAAVLSSVYLVLDGRLDVVFDSSDAAVAQP
jgi:phosphatidylserine/phosphatidylglycerophosphate/cardiolipin synthase-like enzyme